MSFKTFLIESRSAGGSELSYHKLLSGIDTAHVTTSDGKYEFNLGSVIKDSEFKNLFVRIVKARNDDVRLGKHSDGRYFIVVRTTKFPERMEIDSMLSSNKAIKGKFIEAMNTFHTDHRDTTAEVEPSKHEKRQDLGDSKNYEQSYQALVDAIDHKKTEYEAAVAELTKNEQSTVNEIKKSTIQAAKAKLRAEYFGKSEGEFVKLVMKYPEADFISLLDKEIKDKTVNRLENYYDQRF